MIIKIIKIINQTEGTMLMPRTTRSATATATASLKEYRAKRNFTKSPEPTGGKRASSLKSKRQAKQLFFCVQKHLASHLHYDFRLEHRGVLLSWAVPKGPSLNPADKRLAMKVEDHPHDYGEFEGVIPEGYGAGIVMLWDRGTWKPESDNVDAALKKGELKFSLQGVKLKGSWVLVRIRGKDSRTWLLIKHRDKWAGEVDVVKAAPLSVKSFGDFEDILAKDKPDIWLSDRAPARGGEAGAMLRKIIAKAMKLRSDGQTAMKKTQRAKKSKQSPKAASKKKSRSKLISR